MGILAYEWGLDNELGEMLVVGLEAVRVVEKPGKSEEKSCSVEIAASGWEGLIRHCVAHPFGASHECDVRRHAKRGLSNPRVGFEFLSLCWRWRN